MTSTQKFSIGNTITHAIYGIHLFINSINNINPSIPGEGRKVFVCGPIRPEGSLMRTS
jgi:hypothetical protein